MPHKAVILDRDKTLNYDPGYLNDADKVKLLPGVTEGLNLLATGGFNFYIATNQSGVGRSLISREQLDQVNARLVSLLREEGISIEKIYVCPHTDADNCNCRKPKPGLIEQILNEQDIDIEHCYLIGDRYRDLAAGLPFNLPGILVPFGDDEDNRSEDPGPANMIGQSENMKEAAAFILEREFENSWLPKLYLPQQREKLIKLRDSFKQKGLKTVFTNGCFDLLHPGHMQYLKQARSLGDRLILGLNSDDSVRKLKGPSRPVNNEYNRALNLAQLDFVDIITVFTEDTPEELISLLKPDIHVKGGDYKAEELPEYNSVKLYGGEVVILPFRQGHSTTLTIEKMSKN